jgi:K+-sensing histidine kinase KdpD
MRERHTDETGGKVSSRRWLAHPVARYGAALGLAAMTTGAVLALRPLVEYRPDPPFLLATLVVAWFAGFGPAVVTCAFSVAALNYLFGPPLYTFSLPWHEAVSAALFTAIALLMAGLAGARRRATDDRIRLLARERAARAEAERAAERLRELQTVTDTIVSHAGLEQLLRAMLRGFRIALRGDTAAVLLLDERGTHLRLVASDGFVDSADDDVPVPVGRGVAGKIATAETGLIFDDLSEADVVHRSLKQVASLVGVPLRIEARLIGVVHVGSYERGRFTDDDRRLLRLAADRAALAIERAQLMETALDARASAERANRAKDEFLAVLGHELRNPLTAITTAVGVLDRIGNKEEPAVHAREIISRQAQHVGRLVDDLLQVNRLLAGKMVLDRRPIDLADAVRRCVATLRGVGTLDRHAVELELKEAWVNVDAVRLDQVVMNLVENAVKYTPAGGVITVTLRRERRHAVLGIRDNGIGIPADLLPRIFEPFVQGETGSRRSGLGIGLSVVRRLVEMHEGSVQVSSDGPGRGSSFVVRLPAIPVAIG